MAHPYIRAAQRKGFYVKANGKQVGKDLVARAVANDDASIVVEGNRQAEDNASAALTKFALVIEKIDFEFLIATLEQSYETIYPFFDNPDLVTLGFDGQWSNIIRQNWSKLTEMTGAIRAISNGVESFYHYYSKWDPDKGTL